MSAADLTTAIVDGAHAPAGLAEDRLALWTIERDHWSPRTITVTDAAGTVLATALTAGRPHTAYRKVVDLVVAEGAGDSAEAAAIAALEAARDDRLANDDGSQPAPIVIRFEEHPAQAALTAVVRSALATVGFAQDADSLPSVPSTRPEDAAFTRSWSLWLSAAPTRAVPYYGQTTDVTCGAVTSLMMFEENDLGQFSTDGTENHTVELDFWRRATNMPACEPIGLAVTTAEELLARTGDAGRKPRVILSAEGPVLLEWYDDFYERKLRVQLQEESLRTAESLGLEVERRWASTEEIRDLVAAGNDVFLLIALEPLIKDPAAHWVLAHDVVGDNIIISDPWVEQEHGESWVDTSALPIPLAGIDLITRWGEPEYRGIIVVPR